jgi:hypothetical protein
MARYYAGMLAPALVLVAAVAATAGPPVVTVTRADFGGHQSLVLRSDAAEVVVVPALGRIMRFALRDGGGPFWSNPAIAGGKLAPDAEGWVNAGGDKAWPAPQADWPKIAGKGWPPPATFDSTPFMGWINGRKIELVSEIDPTYGIRVHRTIELAPRAPVMTVATTFEKVRGAPVRVAIWTITQLASPERVAVKSWMTGQPPQGYVSLLPDPPKDLRVQGHVISLARDPDRKTMIGSDDSTLVWVGDGPSLVVQSLGSWPTGGDLEWPKPGIRSQIYTNPGTDAKYVELEVFDHLRELRAGQRAMMKVAYTLSVRQEKDPEREIVRALGPR